MNNALAVVDEMQPIEIDDEGNPRPRDPSKAGFHPMLPVELAMRTDTVPNICAAYGVTKERFEELIDDPLFATAYKQAQEELKKDGVSFKLKAKMQAEALLAKSWEIIHDRGAPSTVKADLIKATVRWAGYEPKGDGAGLNNNAFQININLG